MGRNWPKIRRRYMRLHPRCEVPVGAAGEVLDVRLVRGELDEIRLDGKPVLCGQPTEHVHHIKRKADGGTDHDDNLLAACARHHNRETAIVDCGWGGPQ